MQTEATRHHDDAGEWIRSGQVGLVPNGDDKHAIGITAALFEQADKIVRILTQQLERVAYSTPEMLAAANGFLAGDSNRVIRILVIDQKAFGDVSTHPFLRGVRDPARVDVRFVHPRMLSAIGFNFAVTDRGSYRYEADLENKVGFATVDDASLAAKLVELFDDLWSAAPSPVRALEKAAA